MRPSPVPAFRGVSGARWVDPDGAEDAYLAARTWVSPAMKAAPLWELDARCPAWIRSAHAGARTLRAGRAWDPLSRIQYVETKTYLPGDLLTKVDRASMAHGLEVRVPLLDHRLVEFAARIPPELKLRNGVSKAVLRQALGERIPPQMTGAAQAGLLHAAGGVDARCAAPLVRAAALRGQTIISEWVNLDVVREWWDEHQRGRNLNRFFWSLVVLESWAAQHVASGASGRWR
jgi:asparagine synthase (glutamine-hydrolysing)